MDYMDFLREPGFLGTGAPMFMDFVTVVIVLMPLLVAGGIRFAKQKKYGLHAAVNTVLMVTSILVLGFYEYGILQAASNKVVDENALLSNSQLLWIIGIHIALALITLGMWVNIVLNASKHYEAGLPGIYSKRHARAGKRLFIAIVVTSLLSLWIYYMVYVH